MSSPSPLTSDDEQPGMRIVDRRTWSSHAWSGVKPWRCRQ
jgi:hypothetical protein